MLETDKSMWLNITTEPGTVSGSWMAEEAKRVAQLDLALALMTLDYFQHLFDVQESRLLVPQNCYEA